MSLDKSLRIKGAHTRHRNVLSRSERIERLAEEGKWTEETDSVFGLPKVRNIMLTKKRKGPAKEAEGAAEGAEGAKEETPENPAS